MGNTQISFYTPDRKGSYIGVIQGITIERKPAAGISISKSGNPIINLTIL